MKTKFLFSDKGYLTQEAARKTALHGKIDDFETICEWQRSCYGPFDEVDPKWVGR